MFVVYGVAGALSAAIVTDFVQGILTVVFSFIPVPGVLRAVGGIGGLRETLADPRLFSLVAPGEIGFFLAALPAWMMKVSGTDIAISLPWQMVCYLAAGVAAGVVTSLFTKPLPREKVDAFFAVARTPVEVGEPEPETPCTLACGVEPAEPSLLVDAAGIEITRPARSALIGFVVCWIAVAMRVGAFYVLTR